MVTVGRVLEVCDDVACACGYVGAVIGVVVGQLVTLPIWLPLMLWRR